MFSVRPLPEFTTWLDGLKDLRVRGAVVERIKRLSFGLLGDFKAIGDGVIELRIDFGAGWRLYYTHGARRSSSCLRAVPNAHRRKISRGQGFGRIAEKRRELEIIKTINVDDLPEFDPAQYLDNEESIAVYLTGILEANNAALLASALGDIARARGMTEIAKAAGITREALYKALRPNSAPRFDTISRVCAALGVRLVAQPMPASKAAA
jgi:probable addiction module antidote protein/putative addiction module killer protein